MNGKVYLVGAGPGDPSLITVKGLDCLRRADVVVHDYLANPRLLSEVRDDCELIFVGKRHDKHFMEQDQINELLVAKAEEGHHVVRLKGGDPFVFGRGGEEAAVLAEHGIEFEVVPGVSAAYAVPEYAGIPVTHRHMASDVAFVTGHQVDEDFTDINWERLALGVGTVVFLMGVTNLAVIAAELVKHGRASETPVAVIRWGTMPEQQTVVGTLADIADKVKAAGLHPPAVVVVGEVVKLRERLSWFEKKPLFGLRVLVTRSRAQAASFIDALEQLGAEAIAFPTIATRALGKSEVLDAAIRSLFNFDWVIFTSANGVRYFYKRLREMGLDLRALGAAKVACVGPATAKALKVAGVTADLMPADYLAEGLLEEFSQTSIAGQNILIPRARVAREVLPKQLAQMGAEVTVAPCYETVTADTAPHPLAEQLRSGRISYATFTSASTVKGYAAILGKLPDSGELLAKTKAVCIGPVTEAAARKHGLDVTAVAAESTTEGMLQVLLTLASQRPAL